MKRIFTVVLVLSLCLCLSMIAFATDEKAVVVLTEEQFSVLIESVTGSIAEIVPVGITIFGIIYGINLIPKIISIFRGGNYYFDGEPEDYD